MIDDLKEIKKIYGEKLSHLCRDNFSKILNESGVLLSILKKYFAPTRSLYQDIIDSNLVDEFKNFIYCEYDIIQNKNLEENKEVLDSPYEILDKAGYILYECKTEDDIQSFKKWYKNDEVICTIYNGRRLNRCYVFFAVKKNAYDIKRENFACPKREDLYSTSVLSIQFPKHGTCVPDIISRYNHTVRDPNGTYGCNLNKIAPNLEESFDKLLENRGIKLNKSNANMFDLPNYTIGPDGKYYRYNTEVNGIYYCENNVIVDYGKIKKYDLEKYIIADNFIIDFLKKSVSLYHCNRYDSFLDGLKNIKNMNVVKNGELKNIIIKKDNCEDIIITINKHNSIVEYRNNNITSIKDQFLLYNKELKKIELSNVKSIGNMFLYSNKILFRINISNVRTIGYSFLRYNKELEELDIPESEIIGFSFLIENEKLKKLNGKKIRYVGDNFLSNNKSLENLELPNIEKIGNAFLFSNEILKYLDILNVIIIGDWFLKANTELKSLNLPNLKRIGQTFMNSNKKIEYINMPISFIEKVDNPRIKKLLMKRQKNELLNIKNNLKDFKNNKRGNI